MTRSLVRGFSKITGFITAPINIFMQLKLIFQNSHIVIQLKQHPTIEKWFKFFQKLTSNQPNYYRMFFSDEFKLSLGRNSVDHKTQWKIIQDSLDTMRSAGYTVPFDLPTEFDFSQPTLNQLHRFFTYNCDWWHRQSTEPNPFDENFRLPEDWDFTKWYSIIGLINEAVHCLEVAVTTPTKLLYQTKPNEWALPSWVINNPASITGELIETSYLPFNSNDQSLNYEPMDFSRGAAVTLNASILGKCMLQSYFEEDDPTARDASGREGSYGGYCIHLTRGREKIYRSEHFGQWAARHGRPVDSLPLEFQIGHVAGTSLADLFKFDPQRYIRTEFVD
jgi:hypothetical protein